MALILEKDKESLVKEYGNLGKRREKGGNSQWNHGHHPFTSKSDDEKSREHMLSEKQCGYPKSCSMDPIDMKFHHKEMSKRQCCQMVSCATRSRESGVVSWVHLGIFHQISPKKLGKFPSQVARSCQIWHFYHKSLGLNFVNKLKLK